MYGWKTGLVALITFALLAVIAPAASGATSPEPMRDPIDWEAPMVSDDDPRYVIQGLFDDDPTGLVPKTPFVQRYSLDEDYWEVWLCGSVSLSMGQVLDKLNSAAVSYFDAVSGGLYEPVFSAGGSKPSDPYCRAKFIDGDYSTVGSPEGILIVDSVTGSGGYASPGVICINDSPDCTGISATFPGNRRYAVLGEPVLGQPALDGYPSIIVHELGHTLQWPHSNSGSAEYDNPLDLMSGNTREGGGTEQQPYSTLSYSRFQSGWVAPGDVVVADGSYQSMTLQPFDVAGTQLFAIKTSSPGRFYVFGARTTSAHDPIPADWQGVEVYEVDYYCDEQAFGGICPGIYREHTQQPPSPGGVGHVLQPGESVVLEGLTVTVTAATATGYTLTADPDPGVDTEPSAPGAPTAVPGDQQATISWDPAGDGGSSILNYHLEVENRSGGGSTVTDVGDTLSTVSGGLTNGTTYRARVRATNAIGDGPWSSWSADFVPATVPSVPSTPSVTAGAASMSVSWTAPGDNGGSPITGYELQLNDQTEGSDTYIGAGVELSEDLPGLTNGHTYRVRVRADNALGPGPWSGWSAGVTPGSTPGVPLNLSIAVTAVDAATASWSPPTDDGGFAISRYELALENRSGGSAATYDAGTATTYGLLGLTTSNTYRYRVRAENSEGWGAWSAWSPDFIPGTVPSAPGVPDVTAGDAEVTAIWAASTGLGSAVDEYQVQLENITQGSSSTTDVGTELSRTFGGLANGDAYRVRVRAHNDSGWGPWSAFSAAATPLPPPNTFIDDDGSVFEADIEWLAAAGITQGCNPPVNDRYCPDGSVTRGQMAAFLVRALRLPAGTSVDYVDDDSSVFEADIEKLAAAGITRGCNPPTNDRFCPNNAVTRGQMSAFLVRALELSDDGGGNTFVDDDGSVFESDIAKLAAAGITQGCNPPNNDRFCPDRPVTRGQMAAFLHRALTLGS